MKLHIIQQTCFLLHAPYIEHQMENIVHESIQSSVRVVFMKGGCVLYEASFYEAGLEIVD